MEAQQAAFVAQGKSAFQFIAAAVMLALCLLASMNRMWNGPEVDRLPGIFRAALLLLEAIPFISGYLLRRQIGKWASSGKIDPEMAESISSDVGSILSATYLAFTLVL